MTDPIRPSRELLAGFLENTAECETFEEQADALLLAFDVRFSNYGERVVEQIKTQPDGILVSMVQECVQCGNTWNIASTRKDGAVEPLLACDHCGKMTTFRIKAGLAFPSGQE